VLQVERQRRGLKPDLLGYDACRQTFGTLFDQQPKNGEAMLVSKSTEGRDCFGGLHGSVRYYEYYRNVNL
jgi:hypothetical protein